MHVLFCASGDLKDAKYIRKGNKNLLQMKFGTGDTIAMCGKVVECKRTKFGVMLTLNDGENFVITAGTFNERALQDAVNVLQKFSEGNKEIYLLIYANPFYKGTLYLNANQDNSVIESTKQIYEKFHEIRKKGLMHLTRKFKVKPEETAEKGRIEIKEEKEEKTTKKASTSLRSEISKTGLEMSKKEEVQMPKEKEKEKEEIKEDIKEDKEDIKEDKEDIKEDKEDIKEDKEDIKEDIAEYKNVFENAEISADEYKKQRAINMTIVGFVENLAKDKKDNMVKIEDVASELYSHSPSLKDINLADKIYELLEMGYFYEPKPGYIKVIG
ncbi:MAG: hypothetical protein GW910_04490 [Candidatus Altiarchaeum hamiconexum]|uniref:Uncharacterized protein n=1 Tax=Candidatus Altarchaeum hamiconexum TaxID=1803513 RepID=A0A8J7YV83_9ARCH|nr:hypothetical protein [Candidatus Altarchaeum hamiconexum]